MRSINGFSFFSKMTSSRKRHSSSKKPSSFSTPVTSFNSSEIDRTIDNAAEIIEKWNTEYVSEEKFHSLFCERKPEAKMFVKRVKDLQNVMDSLIKEDPNSEKLIRAQKLMQIAMKRLQNEFVQILSMNRAHFDPESFSTTSSTSVVFKDDISHESRSAQDSIIEVEDVSKNSITELKSIAECMIASGYAKECASVYKSIRKSIVDEGIYRLGVERISSSKAKKMPCEVFELMIKRSIEAVKVSMKILFNGERTLCDEVFESSFHLRESCFRDIAKEGALLFSLPETFAVRDKKNPNPAKIFPLLDLYCTITEHLPFIESTFSFSSTSIVRSQAIISLNRLSESILSHLMDLESQIRKDSSKTMVTGGGLHPMTISAMNHLSKLSDYSSVLVKLLNGSSSSFSSAKTLLPQSYFNISESNGSPRSEVRIRFAWLILILLCKIDGKSEMYKEFSTQYLFLANNLQHVVSRVQSTNLRQILGNDWIVKHSEKVRQFVRSYERLAWGPLVSICPVITTSEAMEISQEEAKMQFERFDKCFESTCEAQSKSVVADPKLLEEMRISIVRKILQIYRDFYNSHRNGVMLAGREGEWIIRYTPEDIGNELSKLFSVKGISDYQYVCMSDQSTKTTRPKPRSSSCRRF